MKKDRFYLIVCLAAVLIVGVWALCDSIRKRQGQVSGQNSVQVRDDEFQKELSVVTTTYARELESSLEGKYEDLDECDRVYKSWKLRRKSAVQAVYEKYDKTPPD